MEGMICYLPGSICYGSKDFYCSLCMIVALDLLSHSLSPNGFDHRFVD
jgi:hypothetical protein